MQLLLQTTESHFFHFYYEILAYIFAGFIFRNSKHKKVDIYTPDGILMLGIIIFFAYIGSKIVHMSEHYYTIFSDPLDLNLLIGGKSVLGALIFGAIGAEIAKKLTNIKSSTGDQWLLPLVVGLCIGRLGCQVSGAFDQTYGAITTFPIAFNYGDGLARHGLATYEIILNVLAYLSIRKLNLFERFPGASFSIWMMSYCLIRFCLEFLKPPINETISGTLPIDFYFGFTGIQYFAFFGFIYFFVLSLYRLQLIGKTHG